MLIPPLSRGISLCDSVDCVNQQSRACYRTDSRSGNPDISRLEPSTVEAFRIDVDIVVSRRREDDKERIERIRTRGNRSFL